MTRYCMLIQAAYAEEPLSRTRLAISRETVIPSLAAQTTKPTIHLQLNNHDPLLQDRLDAFRATGCEVVPLFRREWKLYRENWELPAGRKIVSRCDDDDALPTDFCQRTAAAAPRTGDHALIWPRGYVYWRDTVYSLVHPESQFVTLVTDGPQDPHQFPHQEYTKRYSTVVVSLSPGWIWVRHGAAHTPTLQRYRQKELRGIDSSRFAVNLRSISRTVADAGPQYGTYRQHRAAKGQANAQSRSGIRSEVGDGGADSSR